MRGRFSGELCGKPFFGLAFRRLDLLFIFECGEVFREIGMLAA